MYYQSLGYLWEIKTTLTKAERETLGGAGKSHQSWTKLGFYALRQTGLSLIIVLLLLSNNLSKTSVNKRRSAGGKVGWMTRCWSKNCNWGIGVSGNRSSHRWKRRCTGTNYASETRRSRRRRSRHSRRILRNRRERFRSWTFIRRHRFRTGV